jgi:hypothetical protein
MPELAGRDVRDSRRLDGRRFIRIRHLAHCRGRRWGPSDRQLKTVISGVDFHELPQAGRVEPATGDSLKGKLFHGHRQ